MASINSPVAVAQVVNCLGTCDDKKSYQLLLTFHAQRKQVNCDAARGWGGPWP